MNLLATADFVLLLLSPYQLLNDVDTRILSHPNLVIVIDGAVVAASDRTSIVEKLQVAVRQSRRLSILPEPGSAPIAFVASDTALSAATALKQAIASDQNRSSQMGMFERFHRQAMQAEFEPLKDKISTAFRPSNERHSIIGGIWVADLVFQAIREATKADRSHVDAIAKTGTAFRQEVLRVAQNAEDESVIERGVEGAVVEGGVADALRRSRSVASQVLDQEYRFLGLISGKVDEVARGLQQIVMETYGADLGRQVRTISSTS